MMDGFDYELENTEVLVSYKIVGEELLRRTIYMVEVAQTAIEEENWGLMAGAMASMENANEAFLEITAAASALIPQIEGEINATTMDVWIDAAQQEALKNGYRLTVEAEMVRDLANKQLEEE